MLLAIDPGVDCGWAHFDDNKYLIGCGLGEPALTPDSVLDLSEIVIECPMLRPRGEKNPNAILKVARNAGEWAGRFGLGKARYVLPNEWKGNTPKDISHARIWAKLSAAEQGIVDTYFRTAKGRNGLAPSKRHNVLDAIGIGLFGVGR